MTDAPAPEAEPAALVIDLSTEELSFLLEMLGVREIPGFVFETETDELIRSVVRHSLSARGAIARDIDGEWRISELVEAAITAGVRASRYLTVRRDGAPAEDWLYILPSVVVQYSRVTDYVHRFQAIFTPEGLVETLVGLLELAPPESVDPFSAIYPAAVFDLRRLVREGRADDAHRAADRLGIPDDLRAALITPIGYAALSASAVRGGRALVMGGLVVAVAQQGQYWLLAPMGDSVRADKSDSSEAIRRIGDLLQA
ncbi:MAG: hypothetical protein IPK52_23665 [Chloroflexi bacterium]|nr:hypothetical protein [Chloroflexota bacterium]